MKTFGVNAFTARDVSNELTEKNIPDDMAAEISEYAGEEWAKLTYEPNGSTAPQTGGNETPPQPAPAQPAPAFLSTLAEISAGKYDHEGTTRIGDRIDEIMDPMDDAIMKQYETELNAALDHLTILLKEKAAKYL